MDGFLIGSSIMLSDDLEAKVREFVLARAIGVESEDLWANETTGCEYRFG